MSHVATVATEIRDLDCLSHAAQVCGLELVRGQRTFKHYQDSQPNECEHVLRIPDDETAYEIGLVKDENGNYRLLMDDYGNGLRIVRRLGKNHSKLKQAYVKHKVIKTLQKQGFQLTKEVNLESGTVSLTLHSQINLS
jgi:hypothetical protein